MDKVIENEVLLKKTNWQRKTYPLKLNLTDVQKCKLDMMFYEYKKATNKIIDIVLNEFFTKHLVQLTEELNGKCPLCQKEKKLKYQLNDFYFKKYGELKGKPIYKPIYKKGESCNICGFCYMSHYSLRKFLSPSKNRELPIKEWDFTKYTRMKNNFDSCLQKAVETIKSQEQIKQKLKWRINNLRERIMNNNIQINKKSGEAFEKYGEQLLKKFIKKDERLIEKLKKRFAENIEFKGTAIRLYDNSYSLIKEDNEFYIKLKNFLEDKEFMTIEFFGDKYQKKLANKFIKSKNAETELIKKGDDFYLQYIYRKEINVPIPDETFTSVGIDVNIINLSSYVSMNKELKPMKVNFYSGRKMRDKRKRFKEMRKIWASKTKRIDKGGKGREWKWFIKKKNKQNEKNYVKYNIHNLTTLIVQEIKDTIDKPVIVMENLKDIRDRIGKELKIKKCSIEKLDKKQQKSIRGEKLLNSELNNWNFDDFQKFIEYKANWLGIPVVYVKAKDTSIKCNKCGNIKEENYEDWHRVKFKCCSCSYECNADFNASVNIAREFYKNL